MERWSGEAAQAAAGVGVKCVTMRNPLQEITLVFS